VPLPAFRTIALAPDLGAALAEVPALPGVAQIVADDRNLLIGRPANLRRWAATHLGRGKPVPKGKRPPTDLSAIASAVLHAVTTSAFQQRLVFERLMARYVPLSARRDLKPPAFLHLDPSERFPRIVVKKVDDGEGGLFGPFRDRRAADKAREALHKRHPLRPCDYTFEPDPALPLGLGCLYAQVRTCAAPCLSRVSEPDYRALAARVADVLARPSGRSADEGLPPWVAGTGGRGVVVARGGEGVELYPVLAGRVLDEAVVSAPAEGWEAAVASLAWADPPADDRPSDWPWLTAWLSSPAGRASWLVAPSP
jgi:hypothetical protein